MIRAQIVAAAREWLDTPYVHQGRLLGVGVDCAGLIVGVARTCGLSDYDVSGYARIPDGSSLQAACDETMTRADEPQLGDVLLFRFERQPQHLAFVADYAYGGLSIVHAYAPAGKVVETRFDEQWQRRLVQTYVMPGVA